MGWENHKTAVKVIRATAQISVDSFTNLEPHQERIKSEIATEITKHLINSDLITISKDYDVNTLNTVYKGYIDVVKDPNLKSILMDEYIYVVENKKFSHEQIEEAIKNTFPEYFI